MFQPNSEVFQEVVQQAFDAANGNRRWETAIVRAKQIAESNPFVHFDGDKLLILSDSNIIYEVTAGRCQTAEGRTCKAFEKGQPCKHRALRRLVIRYNQTSH